MVTPFFHGLLLLTVIGAAVFTAGLSPGRASIASLIAGFLSTAWCVKAQLLPDPVWVGSLAALTAALQLFRPHYRLVSVFAGGALAGLCGALSGAIGLTVPAGTAFGAAEIAVIAYLSSRNPGFAPRSMYEEALAGLVGLGSLVALLPGVLAGWQTAVSLSASSSNEGGGMNLAIPTWTIAISMIALVSGGLYSLWRHR